MESNHRYQIVYIACIAYTAQVVYAVSCIVCTVEYFFLVSKMLDPPEAKKNAPIFTA